MTEGGAEAPWGSPRTCRLPLLTLSEVVDVLVTVSSSQAGIRHRRQLEHRGPAHPSQARLPGAVTVRGFPNTLIQVGHIRGGRQDYAAKRRQEVVYATGAAGGRPVKS